jgi:hypothetical protein
MADPDSQFFLYRQEHMVDLTKQELLEKLLKLVQTTRDLNFLLLLEKKDLTTLLITLRERIENQK